MKSAGAVPSSGKNPFNYLPTSPPNKPLLAFKPILDRSTLTVCARLQPHLCVARLTLPSLSVAKSIVSPHYSRIEANSEQNSGLPYPP